jgi:hypothetical protein
LLAELIRVDTSNPPGRTADMIYKTLIDVAGR